MHLDGHAVPKRGEHRRDEQDGDEGALRLEGGDEHGKLLEVELACGERCGKGCPLWRGGAVERRGKLLEVELACGERCGKSFLARVGAQSPPCRPSRSLPCAGPAGGGREASARALRPGGKRHGKRVLFWSASYFLRMAVHLRDSTAMPYSLSATLSSDASKYPEPSTSNLEKAAATFGRTPDGHAAGAGASLAAAAVGVGAGRCLLGLGVGAGRCLLGLLAVFRLAVAFTILKLAGSN